MPSIAFGTEYLKEIENEVRATRRCLEAIPESTYGYKPHEKSMNMGYLALLVADIPRWIIDSIEKSEIDLATYGKFELSTNAALLKYFDRNIEGAKRVLAKVTDEELDRPFQLKSGGKVLFTTSTKENVQSSINHWVHHRGQLTVYMRMNDIAVPSIYGPSADEKTF
jgi:uncharacterized damage-inducible protein DinB